MLKLLKKHKTTHPADAPGRLFSDLAEQSADVARPVKASGFFLEIDGDRIGKWYEMVGLPGMIWDYMGFKKDILRIERRYVGYDRAGMCEHSEI